MNTGKHVRVSRLLSAVLVLIIGFIFFGCTYSVNQYGSSLDTTDKIKQLQSPPLAVDKFESYRPDLKSIVCRANGVVATPDEVSFETYIERAFIDELKQANAYDPKSPAVVHGRLEEINFISSVGKGKWFMKLAVSSNTNPGYAVDSAYEFSANWVAFRACQQVAQAFVPAVQQLISQVVSDPRFKQLAQ